MSLTKGLKAEGEIKQYTIVQYGTNDNQAKTATAKTQQSIGVVGQKGGDEGDHVDVVQLGEEFVKVGAAVTAGDKFVANASGHAVPFTVGTGETVHYVGIINQTCTEVGGVVRCTVCPGVAAK